MTTPDCTDHGPLILEYVRGNLSEADSLRAETVLGGCRACREWMDREFSGPAFATVDQAVAKGLKNAPLPNRRHRFGWMAAAAAVVIVAGGLLIMGIPNRSTPMMPVMQDQVQSTRIGGFDFEDGTVGPTSLPIDERTESVEAPPLFSDDLEDGIAGSWTIHT